LSTIDQPGGSVDTIAASSSGPSAETAVRHGSHDSGVIGSLI
jgi:hypothetical protein